MAPKQSTFRTSRLSPEIGTVLIRGTTERSLLGALLFLPSAQASIAGLHEEDFALSSNQTVFRRIKGLAETSRPIDLTTAVEELNRHGELDAVGGPAYVSGLLDGVPDTPNVEHYVTELRQASGLRRLHHLSESIPALLRKGGTLQEIIAGIDRAVEPERLLVRRLHRSDTPGVLNGETILNELVTFLRRFVHLTTAQACVVVLWIIHTHAFAAADATPYLAITSAEMRSGKTRLLEVLQLLVANPWMTGRVSAACLVRKIDAQQPALLLDETDTAFASDKEYGEALRGMLNSGHRRDGKASCCVGQGANVTFKDFRTFSPKAIAGIGSLPGTVADRSIPIRLKRKLPGEGCVERFREREVKPQAQEMRDRVAGWADSHIKRLQDARPILPEVLTDRQQDGVEPLLAIADQVGGDWRDLGRKALVEVLLTAPAEDTSFGVRLLLDVKQIFEERGVDRVSSQELVSALVAIETSPWAEVNHGRPLTAVTLSRRLKPFEIRPRSIRHEADTLKGYLRGSFEDAWRRYLPPQRPPTESLPLQDPSHPSQPANDQEISVVFDPSHATYVTGQETAEQAVLVPTVTGVTDVEARRGSSTTLRGRL